MDRITSYVPLLLGLLWATFAVAGPDSLSIRDKAQINKLAQLRLVQDFTGILSTITSYSVESESDAADLEDIVENITQGGDRIFNSPDATIQDNINPEVKSGEPGIDRRVSVYANDFFMYFKGEERDPVTVTLLAPAEPTIVGDLVITKLLYEVTFRGRHKEKTTPYTPRKREMRFIAEQQGTRDWKVYIASDDYYDEAKGFVTYKLETEIKEAKESSAELTPEMQAYLNFARQAELAAEQEREERKKAFDEAIAAGQSMVAAGEFEDAVDVYKQAAKIDPLSLKPTILIKAAVKERKRKELEDKKAFDEQMEKGQKLAQMREYARALDAYVQAQRIIPDDPRCPTLIDSLKVKVQAKSDMESAFTVGNYAACLSATKELLKKRKDDPELLALLAKTYKAMDKNSDALDNANKAIALAPVYAEALYLRARIKETSPAEADQKAAEEDYHKLMTHDRWNMEYAHRIAAMLCFTQRNCRAASALLQQCASKDPINSETYYILGCVHGFGYRGQLQEFSQSVEYLDKALELDSTCAKCWLERGITLLMMDSVEAATRSIAEAKRLKLPEDQQRRAASMADDNFKDAERYRNEEKHTIATKYYASACILQQDNGVYWAARAKNLMSIPRYEEAIEVWDRYLKISDGDYLGRLDRAECLLNLDRYDEVDEEVQKVKRNDIKGVFSERMNMVGGEARFKKGDLIEADGYLSEALKKNKDNAKALSMLAQIAYKRKQFKEAEKYAQDAIEKNRKDPSNKGREDPASYFYLGLIKQQLGDAKGSLKCFDDALYFRYDRDEVLKQKGRSFMLDEGWKAAIGQFDELLISKDDVEAGRWKAQCHLMEGEYNEGLRDLLKVEEKHPEMLEKPEFLAEIGYFYTLTNSLVEAGKALDKAYAADPDYAETILARVAYFWKGSRQEEAISTLSNLVSKGQDEKILKKRPILKDIISTSMWKDRKR